MSLRNWLSRSPRRPIRTRAAARPRLGSEMLETRTVPAALVAVGTDAGIPAAVRVFRDADQNGSFETQGAGTTPEVTLSPFGGFTGGVRVATGDFDGDGNDELVTAAGPGGAPHVIVWDLNPDGTVGGIRDSFFAFDTAFTGGTNIATGDVNDDGKDELVIAADAGGGAHVKVYSDTNANGRLSDNMTDQFFPFANFTGGARLALADTNNAGGDEIVAAAGPGGGPHVKVYTDADADGQVSDNPLAEDFFAYDNAFTGGVYVGAGPLAGAGGKSMIVTGAGAGGGPHVKVYSDANNDGRVGNDSLFDEFFPYDAKFTGGVRVHVGDADDSGFFGEILTVPGPGGGAHVKVYRDDGDAGSKVSDNQLETQFFADAASKVGANVAVGAVRRVSYASTQGIQPIPESGNGVLKTSIFVPAGAGIIRDLDVSLNIDHTFIGDLDVALRHVPTNTTLTLFTDIGGTDSGLYVRLDDEAANDINTADNPADGPVVGNFSPEGAAVLSTFDGLDASGQWELTITDDSPIGNDIGSLVSWTLHVTH